MPGGGTASLPYAGVRVLDLSWVIAGPAATQWLANLGAEVILVESPTHQSVHRVINWGGLIGEMSDPNAAHGGFNSINYGKRGCLLDIATPAGRDLAMRLVAVSDIVVTAHTSKVLRRLGLAYDDLVAVNPSVIALSISSFGSDGPFRDVAGYGPSSQSYVGVTKMMGYEGSEGGLGIGGFYPDYTVAAQSAFLLTAALHRRRRTGEGAHLDISMVESVLAMLPQELLDVQMNDRIASVSGNSDPHAVPHELYPCEGDDHWIAIAVFDETQWQSLCATAGRPDWAGDPRFADLASRRRNRRELDALMASWTRTQVAEEVVERLQAAGVPSCVCAHALDLVADPQLHHREAFFGLDDSVAGNRLAMTPPVRFSGVRERYLGPAPSPGQDNEYVYKTVLGMSDVEYAELMSSGLIS